MYQPLNNTTTFFSGEKVLNDVHDVHHVHQPKIYFNSAANANEESTAKAVKVIDAALLVCAEEPAVLASPEFLEAVKAISGNQALWFTYRSKIKAAKPSGVPMAAIDGMACASNEGSQGSDSVASDLISLVQDSGELFFDEDSDKAYFHGSIKGVDTTLSIKSKSFTEWLSFAFYTKTKAESGGKNGTSASEQSIKQAGFALCGIAKHEGIQQRVYLRVADANGGHYVAIGNDRLQVVEVLPTGWRVLDNSPVKFWKPANSKSLPIPQAGGDYSRLWNYVNTHGDDRLLILAWMLDCYREYSPNPVLLLNGGQGCAKSSSQKRLRELIDNNAVNLRGAPKTVEDIFVSAGCNWLVSYENMSNLSPQMQDALCTLATGGGHATRAFYTNDEEATLKAKRPVIINGISNVITAQDLTDRSVQVELKPIDYIDEAVINAEWEKDAPVIFGGIMDLFVKTLEQLPKVKLNKPPRMTDFTKLGEAMCQAIGKPDGYFTRIYTANRKESIGKAMEASPAALAIRDMVEDFTGAGSIVFSGTMKKLLEALEKHKTESNAWPRGCATQTTARTCNIGHLNQYRQSWESRRAR